MLSKETRQLLGIQFDDQLLVDVLANFISSRQRRHTSQHLIRRHYFQPSWPAAAGSRLECALDVNVVAAFFSDSNLVPDLYLEAGNIDLSSIYADVAVPDYLSGLSAGGSVTQPVNRVIETAFDKREQVLAGYAFHPNGPLKIEAELPL